MTTRTIMTAAEFFQTGPETDGCELVRGEVVRMPPPSREHGRICGNLVFVLKSYLKQRGSGELVCNDSGVVTQQNPDTVRGIDVAVFLTPRRADGTLPEVYSAEPPDLAAEVRSPSQRWREMHVKVSEYLETIRKEPSGFSGLASC
ncbi:MAG: Uma2 family endonuclease [Gemmataceae bacterium]|nr:Uma2 family endonuclease [Gemmataceae bacterium]